VTTPSSPASTHGIASSPKTCGCSFKSSPIFISS
jgi:hypothetical protein